MIITLKGNSDLKHYQTLFTQITEEYQSRFAYSKLFRNMLEDLTVTIRSTDSMSEPLDGYYMTGAFEMWIFMKEGACVSEKSFAFTAAHELTHAYLDSLNDNLKIYDVDLPDFFEECLCNTIAFYVADSLPLTDNDGGYAKDCARIQDQLDFTHALMGPLESHMKLDGYTVLDEEQGTYQLDAGNLWYAIGVGHPKTIEECWDYHTGEGNFPSFSNKMETYFKSADKTPAAKQDLLDEIKDFRTKASNG